MPKARPSSAVTLPLLTKKIYWGGMREQDEVGCLGGLGAHRAKEAFALASVRSHLYDATTASMDCLRQLVQHSLVGQSSVADPNGVDECVDDALDSDVDLLVAGGNGSCAIRYFADFLAFKQIDQCRLAVARAADDQNAALGLGRVWRAIGCDRVFDNPAFVSLQR